VVAVIASKLWDVDVLYFVDVEVCGLKYEYEKLSVMNCVLLFDRALFGVSSLLRRQVLVGINERALDSAAARVGAVIDPLIVVWCSEKLGFELAVVTVPVIFSEGVA